MIDDYPASSYVRRHNVLYPELISTFFPIFFLSSTSCHTFFLFFFFNHPPPPEISPLPLPAPLPIPGRSTATASSITPTARAPSTRCSPPSPRRAVGCTSRTISSATTRPANASPTRSSREPRSEEHTSELQSQSNLVCRLLLEKKKKK